MYVIKMILKSALMTALNYFYDLGSEDKYKDQLEVYTLSNEDIKWFHDSFEKVGEDQPDILNLRRVILYVASSDAEYDKKFRRWLNYIRNNEVK